MSLQLCKMVEFDHFMIGDIRRIQEAALWASSHHRDHFPTIRIA